MHKPVGMPGRKAHGPSRLPLAFFAAVLAVAGCGNKQGARPQAAAPPEMPAPPVTVAKAIAQDVPVYLDEIGKTQAMETVTVTPQVAGRITERLFQDGA